jgi:hypothetical protein
MKNRKNEIDSTGQVLRSLLELSVIIIPEAALVVDEVKAV